MRKESLDSDEVLASCQTLARRSEKLSRLARERLQNRRLEECIAYAARLFEAAIRMVDDPNVRIPTLREAMTEAFEPKAIARNMTRSMFVSQAGRRSDVTQKPREPRVTKPRVDLTDLISGNTDSLSVTELLDFLAALRRTGSLEIREKTETFLIEVQEGFAVHASSSHSPAGSRLGDILVERGHITARQLEEFITANSNPSERLGVALEREELITKDALSDALEIQIQMLFNRVCAAEKASFTFSERSSDGADHRVRMSLQHLILESSRVNDEERTTSPSTN